MHLTFIPLWSHWILNKNDFHLKFDIRHSFTLEIVSAEFIFRKIVFFNCYRYAYAYLRMLYLLWMCVLADVRSDHMNNLVHWQNYARDTDFQKKKNKYINNSTENFTFKLFSYREKKNKKKNTLALRNKWSLSPFTVYKISDTVFSTEPVQPHPHPEPESFNDRIIMLERRVQFTTNAVI